MQYHDIVRRVREGGTDEEILWWCFDKGRRPSETEIYVWNEFMRKRGWNDEITETLKRRKKEAGMAGRSEIDTMRQVAEEAYACSGCLPQKTDSLFVHNCTPWGASPPRLGGVSTRPYKVKYPCVAGHTQVVTRSIKSSHVRAVD